MHLCRASFEQWSAYLAHNDDDSTTSFPLIAQWLESKVAANHTCRLLALPLNSSCIPSSTVSVSDCLLFLFPLKRFGIW
eukprot:5222242-Amphidinium_carterae.1